MDAQCSSISSPAAYLSPFQSKNPLCSPEHSKWLHTVPSVTDQDISQEGFTWYLESTGLCLPAQHMARGRGWLPSPCFQPRRTITSQEPLWQQGGPSPPTRGAPIARWGSPSHPQLRGKPPKAQQSSPPGPPTSLPEKTMLTCVSHPPPNDKSSF